MPESISAEFDGRVIIPDRQLEVYSQPTSGVYTSVQLLGPQDEVAVVLDGREVGRIRVADLLP